MTVERISPADARALTERGEAVLLDLRPSGAFAHGHPEGALSLPFSPRGLGRRARVVVPPGVAVVPIAADPATADDAAVQLVEAGVAVRGTLDGGAEAWHAAGLPEAAVKEIGLDDLARVAATATLIDVREPIEWSTGHVPGALLIPLGHLRAAVGSIPRGRPVIAICEAGVRSSTAASILSAAGLEDVGHVPAGSSGYRRSGLPLAFPSEEVLAR